MSAHQHYKVLQTPPTISLNTIRVKAFLTEKGYTTVTVVIGAVSKMFFVDITRAYVLENSSFLPKLELKISPFDLVPISEWSL